MQTLCPQLSEQLNVPNCSLTVIKVLLTILNLNKTIDIKLNLFLFNWQKSD